MSSNRVHNTLGREAARGEAEDELKQLGCTLNSNGTWEVNLDLGAHGRLTGKINLPPGFPDELPEVVCDRASLPHRVPHVERNGKICIAPATGVLLDAGAPRQLIRDALKRARNVLTEGLSGSNKRDLLEEFSAYWNDGAREAVCSICDVSGPSRVVEFADLVVPEGSKRHWRFAADEYDQLHAWATRAEWKTATRGNAFFVQVETAFDPPDFNESISTNALFEVILQSAAAGSRELMNEWLRAKTLPAYVFMSIPLADGQGQVLIAARLEPATGEERNRAHRGFRPGRVPAAIETTFTKKLPVTRLNVRRLDPAYLLPRGGGNTPLLSRTVVIIGCGAIGSHLALNVASLGVGRIRIVDPESLSPENIHRHVLGVGFLDQNKAEGMRVFLNRHYPHIQVEVRPEKVQMVLETHQQFITDTDLIIVALGDETLELSLNNVFGNAAPRIHAWVEPLGIGGHILITGLDRRGCFRCLFQTDKILGLHNQSAFAAPGQKFQPAFSGCAGRFTPFAGVDAQRSSNEAARLASQVLLGRQKRNALVSWRGNADDFSAAGFRLSHRGKMFKPGETRYETDFSAKDCLSCGNA